LHAALVRSLASVAATSASVANDGTTHTLPDAAQTPAISAATEAVEMRDNLI
jgi:hypothetical protein